MISFDGTTASVSVVAEDFWSVGKPAPVAVRLTSGKLLFGARNGPLLLNVVEIFDDGKGISTSGRSAFGALIVNEVFSFVLADFWPKHEQSGNDEVFFLTSIGCFSEILTAGTSFVGGLGTSFSNEGGEVFESFDTVNMGSGEGNWNSRFCF